MRSDHGAYTDRDTFVHLLGLIDFHGGDPQGNQAGMTTMKSRKCTDRSDPARSCLEGCRLGSMRAYMAHPAPGRLCVDAIDHKGRSVGSRDHYKFVHPFDYKAHIWLLDPLLAPVGFT